MGEYNNWDNIEKDIRLLKAKTRIILSCEWIRHVLPFYEAKFPMDENANNIIESVERYYLTKRLTLNEESVLYKDDSSLDYVRNAICSVYKFAYYISLNDNRLDHKLDYDVSIANYISIYLKDDYQYVYNTYQSAITRYEILPEWKTLNVINLAKTIWYDRVNITPILADALEDVSCHNSNLLNHLRKDIITRADNTLLELINE